MARNRTPEYINRLKKIEAPNGFKFDIANYLYNPCLSHDYPHFIKKIDEDETTEKIKGIFYEKYYDGTGAYKVETYHRKKEGSNWQVVTSYTCTLLEKSNRFNIKKLLSFCEN